MIDSLERLKKDIESSLSTEKIILEAFRDLIKDEIKNSLKKRLEEKPELRAMLQEALVEYMEAKIKEGASIAKIIKVAISLGLISIPPHIRNEIIEEIIKTFRSEIEEIFRRL